jgi:DDE family transposase/uncharacterized protein DUF4372
MIQSNNISGKPVIRQVLNFIPRDLVYWTAAQHHTDRYTKTFTSYDHLITMLYAVLSDCSSLRELSTAMLACEGKLNHLGIDYFPKRSTLSDANRRRTHHFFEDVYYALLKKYKPVLSDSCSYKAPLDRLFIMDASTITLFNDILKATSKAVNGKKKGGLKIHTLINSNEDVPCLINLTAAALSDLDFTDQVNLPAGSWLVFDRGYRDYNFFKRLTKSNIFFVTREHTNAVYDIQSMGFTDEKAEPLKKDWHVHTIHKGGKLCLRRIVWYDSLHKRTLVFLTNNFELAAPTIAALYKQRWQIELLFKRLKQNFCIKYFLGDSVNAIKIQVWVCLIAHLILKVIQQLSKRKTKWSFSALAALIKYHLMSYIRLFDFLKNPLASFQVLSTKQILQPQLFPT